MTAKISTQAFERAAAQKPTKVVFRLYIAGSSERSTRAIQNAKEICEEHLAGTYELAIIDIYQQPRLAREDQILAVPTLIRRVPLPVRRFIGDLSDREVVLRGLELR